MAGGARWTSRSQFSTDPQYSQHCAVLRRERRRGDRRPALQEKNAFACHLCGIFFNHVFDLNYFTYLIIQ